MLKERLLKIFEEYDFSPRKRMGQSFLIDEKTIDMEVERVGAEGREVLEIGAGTGFVTEALAEKARKVIAVEKDPLLVRVLRDHLSSLNNVEIMEGDFLELAIDKADRIFSNVPYSISSQLTFKIAEMQFERAVLCYQKEFARRMVAEPNCGDYSRLSVMSQLNFTVELLENVPKGCFYPVPQVDSTIVLLQPKKVAVDSMSKSIITLLFQHKRKSVRNALADSSYYLKMDKKEIKKICEKIPNKDRRVVSLSKEEILEIAKQLKEAGTNTH